MPKSNQFCPTNFLLGGAAPPALAALIAHTSCMKLIAHTSKLNNCVFNVRVWKLWSSNPRAGEQFVTHVASGSPPLKFL